MIKYAYHFSATAKLADRSSLSSDGIVTSEVKLTDNKLYIKLKEDIIRQTQTDLPPKLYNALLTDNNLVIRSLSFLHTVEDE